MAGVAATAQRARDLCRAGRFADAWSLLEPLARGDRPDGRILALAGAVALELGDAAARRGELAPALAWYERSVAARPDDVQVHHNRGVLLYRAGDRAAAAASYRRALALAPQFAPAHSALGVVESEAGHHAAALDHHARAVALAPSNPEFHNNRGLALDRAHRATEAVDSFDAAIALAPDFGAAWCNRGVALHRLGRFADALASAERAVAIDPDDAEAWSNGGLALHDLHRTADALAALSRATALAPGFPNAWANLGAVLQAAKRHDEALAAYDRALALDPELGEARGDRLHAAMMVCDWSGFDRDVEALCEKVVAGSAVVQPFALLATPASAAVQRRAAALFVAAHWPEQRMRSAAEVVSPRPSERIRIGYFSADFRQHPMMDLLMDVFERHDRERFELHAFSFGPGGDNEPMRARAIAAFDRFHDVATIGDAEAAALARAEGIDIAVDLAGFTQGARPGILAERAAPLQVNYLGYPGTLSAPFVDYVIADEVVLPASSRSDFSEAVAWLPDCYQANAAWQPLGAPETDRAAAGLPAEGFVFCSFNNTFKITPDVFAVWMRLLERVPGSALWLIEANAAAVANLRRAAERVGIAGERLVFAPRTSRDAHLRRHALADLFVDTFHYGAHTTASDALRAGLPVLTRIGPTFASRVAASLCRRVGLDALVATSTEAYEDTAFALAQRPAALADLRQRLMSALPSTTLFEPARFARDLEQLYAQMHARQRAGLPPAPLGPLLSR